MIRITKLALLQKLLKKSWQITVKKVPKILEVEGELIQTHL